MMRSATVSKLVFFVVALLISSVCAALRGQVSDGTYTSPLNNFSVPVHRGLDGRMWAVEDQGDENRGTVAFGEPFGGFESIFYLRLSAETLKIQNDPEKQRANLKRFLSDGAMPNLFKPTSPGANVLHEEHIDAGDRNAYFAIVDLPGLSTIFKGRDTKRGLLIFVKDAFIYMLSTGENPGLLDLQQPPKPLDKLRESERQRLLLLKSRITFK